MPNSVGRMPNPEVISILDSRLASKEFAPKGQEVKFQLSANIGSLRSICFCTDDEYFGVDFTAHLWP